MNDAYDLPYLGTVEIEDRLIEYDGPRLFTVRASNGGRFLAFWAVEAPEESVFWYIPISQKHYQALLDGAIELRSVFENPENARILEVRWDNEEAELRAAAEYAAEYKMPHEVNKDALPKPGYRLREPVRPEKPSNIFVSNSTGMQGKGMSTIFSYTYASSKLNSYISSGSCTA